MNEEAGERTERATTKKREEARQQGQVVKSTEVSSVVLLLAGIMLMSIWGPSMLTSLSTLFRTILLHAGATTLTPDSLRPYFIDGFFILGRLLAPMMLALMLVGMGVNLAQVGFLFSAEAIKPKLTKLDPVAGFSRIFSQDTLVGLIREPIKVVIVGGVGYVLIRGEYGTILHLAELDVHRIVSVLGRLIVRSVLGISVALVALAALDYAYRWWKHERDLRMTKQAVKDETKHQEGNQEVKSKMRSLQKSMDRKRMLDAVPDADVVITNPTHLAVALRYDARTSESPRVVAKGARLIAEKIKAAAAEHDVPIIENKPVARALYETVEVDREIPAELYQAVAEILAFVYRLKQKPPFETR